MNEKGEVNLFPLPLPGTSYLMARHVLAGDVREHHLNPKRRQWHRTSSHSSKGRWGAAPQPEEYPWDPAPLWPPPPPPPPTSPSQLCHALGNTWSSHPATEGLESAWQRRKRRTGKDCGCPTLRHCLQEKIRLYYSLTEGKCPKASFI